REATELRNRLGGLAASVSRSFSEFGWTLDPADQAVLKDTMQKARAVPADQEDLTELKTLLKQLEDGAARLASAMFQTPEGRGAAEAEAGEPTAESLMRSALDDVKKKQES